VYVPAVLKDGVITPVEVLIFNPDGATLNVPPPEPVITGEMLPTVLVQNGLPV